MGSFIVRRIFEGLLLCLEAHYFEGVFSRRSKHRQSGADFLKGLHLPFFFNQCDTTRSLFFGYFVILWVLRLMTVYSV